MSYPAIVSALAWDAIGRPSVADVLGAGVLMKPIEETLLAPGAVWEATSIFRSWVLRRRHSSDTEPTPIT